MSKIVIIDTTINSCYVALTNGASVLGVKQHHDAKSQAAFINTAIKELLDEQGFSFNDLSAVACCMGPGSYTGLRIGLSTAKGLSFALDLPLIGFNRMELIDQLVEAIVLIKARVGEYFIAHYKKGAVVLNPVHQLADQVENYLSTFSNSKVYIIGEEDTFSTYAPIYLPEDYLYKIEDAAGLILQKHVAKIYEDVANVEPLYLKSVYTTIAKKKSL